MINSAEDLKDYFWFCGSFRGREHSVNVSTKVRKEFLLQNMDGKVVVNQGVVVPVKWTNMGGGVWRATVEVGDAGK